MTKNKLGRAVLAAALGIFFGGGYFSTGICAGSNSGSDAFRLGNESGCLRKRGQRQV